MSDITAKYNAAEKLIDDEKFEEAIAALKECVAEDESHVITHLALARVYTKTGDHEDAIKHGVRACELEPTDSFNFTALSVTYQRAWAGTQDQKYIQLAEDAMAKSHQV